jgi:hypothetical protein
VPVILIAGWFYFRTWLYVGSWLATNADASSGFLWWQYPGYHTSKYFTGFGMAFIHPYYSSFHSLLDGIYSSMWGDSYYGSIWSYELRPRWNYEYMSLVYFLAIPACLAVVVGICHMLVALVKGPLKSSYALVLGSFFTMSSFLVYMALKMPFYSTPKAHYALGLAVPLSLTFAMGMDSFGKWLGRRELTLWRAIQFGWLGTVATAVFWSFFIV